MFYCLHHPFAYVPSTKPSKNSKKNKIIKNLQKFNGKNVFKVGKKIAGNPKLRLAYRNLQNAERQEKEEKKL